MEKQKSHEERKMRALWFARTLHDNKVRIQSGQLSMQQQDYDAAWEKIVKDFAVKSSVLV